MPLKKKFLYAFFIILLSIWFVSLLVFSLSTSIWGTQTFPLTINAYVRTILWVSTVLASLISFFLGLYELGILSTLKSHTKHYFEFGKKQPAQADKPIIFRVIPSGTSLEDQEEDGILAPAIVNEKPRKGNTSNDEE